MERQIQRLVGGTAVWTTLLGVPFVVAFVKIIAPEMPWENIFWAIVWTGAIVAGFVGVHVYLLRRLFLTPLGDFFDRDGRGDHAAAERALTAAINLPLIGLYPLPAWFLGILSVMFFMNLMAPLPWLPMVKTVVIAIFTGATISCMQVFWLRLKMHDVVAQILEEHPSILNQPGRIGYRLSLKQLIIAVFGIVIVSSLVAGLWGNRALMSSAVMETVARFMAPEMSLARGTVEEEIKVLAPDAAPANTDFLRKNPEYHILNAITCRFPLEPGREDFPELSCKGLRNRVNQLGEDVWYEESQIINKLMIFTPLPREGWHLVRLVDWKQYSNIVASSNFPSYLLLIYLLLLAGFVAYLTAENVAAPLERLQRLTERISSGELTSKVTIYAETEIGDLAAGMSIMAANLRSMMGKLSSTVDRLGSARQSVSGIAGQVKDGAGRQNQTAEETVNALDEIKTLTRGIEDHLGELASSSDEVASSVFEMNSTLNSISDSIDSLMASVSETSSSITEMASSIRLTAENSGDLSRIAGETAGAMVQMDAAVKTIEENARQTRDYSRLVSESAQDGVRAVDKTIGGIEDIHHTVEKIFKVITVLQQRARDVNKIINVIENITKKTNLLSLNASIIAAGAGEHGKGFAVVADEIRELADKTASSTKGIAEVITATARDTEEAAREIARGRDKVHEGMELARNAGAALEQVLSHTISTGQRIENIAGATGEQVKSSKLVTEAIDRLASMTRQISLSTAALSAGIEQILHASENIRDRTSSANVSATEQAKGFAMITAAVESITDKIKSIHQSTQDLASSTARVFESVIAVKDIAQDNQGGAGRMEEQVLEMSRLSSELESHLQLFDFAARTPGKFDA